MNSDTLTHNQLTHNQTSPYADGPRLLADIGGTNVRFALETSRHCFRCIKASPSDAYPSLQAAISDYLASPAVQSEGYGPIRHAALAIANPVDGDEVRMTNHSWQFSIDALRTALNLETLVVVNDFTALAMALPYLSADQKCKIGGGTGRAGCAIGLIGAGTGLGVSGIIPAGERWIPLRSEGGHVTFSPFDEQELEILRFFWREYRHVSAERLLSGAGLEMIYRALMDRAGTSSTELLDAATIGHRALHGSCAVCTQAIECFCAMLGTVAGNVAMTFGAKGGMYIGGGIAPRLGHLFTNSSFRARFEDKGRFSEYLSHIPTYLITTEYPTFLGVSAILSEKLSGSEELIGAATKPG
jgi:glucokinase